MAQVAAGRRSVGSKLKASRTSAGDQLFRTQSTEALLGELFQGLLQQQRRRSSGGPGARSESRGEKAAETALVAGVDAEITKACEHYERSVQELVAVERHLLQARAKALTEEEKALAEKRQAFHGYTVVDTPTGESSLGTFLDRELLEKYHLLHPTHYTPSHPHILPVPPSHLQPPRESTPTYLQPTSTSTQHTSTSAPAHTHTSHRPPAVQKPSWKDQPTPGEREADRQALARLRQRGDYLRNPRYSSQAQPNTASYGALRKREKGAEGRAGVQSQLDPAAGSSSKTVPFFMAEPKEVIFTDYQAGETYQMNVDIRNVSGCSRQMRIVPLNSPYFTVTRGVCAHPEGLIAPGMHVTCSVTFTPHSLSNYYEEMKVLSHSGQCVIVPLKALRPPPRLSLSEHIECGSCLAGGVREMVIEVENTGGEGRFSLSLSDSQQHQPGAVLQLGPFSISPTEFHLRPSDCIPLQVTFTPHNEGKYGEHFLMDCDNGETLAFSLTGAADVVSVGCVFIGDSSSQEVAQFTATDARQHNQGVDSVISSINYDHYQEPVGDCTVVFDAVNPQNPAYQTVVIRNCSNVDLPFSWELYRPLTEMHPSDGSGPVVSSLVKSPNTPFSVLPSSGTLPASGSHTFLCQFLPPKSGDFCDAAHLVLPHVPAAGLTPAGEGVVWSRVGEDSVSCACLFLHATALPYALEMQPPALLLPAPIPLTTETRRRVKCVDSSYVGPAPQLVSRSVSTLQYTWRQPPPHEGITITPASGSIVAGGGAYCEVVIGRRVEGEFSLHLACDIQHRPHPASLPLHGWTEGPQVSADCASLQFGLVPLGTSSQLTLTLTSHTNTTITVELRQEVREGAGHREEEEEEKEEEESEIFTDHDCLHFNPHTFTLSPHTVTNVTVECRPLTTGRLRSTVQCLVEGKVAWCMSVHAEVQRPAVSLAECRLHEDTAYMGVAVVETVRLCNASLIPTHFTWSSPPLGTSASHCSVSTFPLSGSIGPRETIPIAITATWDSAGTHPETVLHCNVEGMVEPLLLVLSAQVHGLAVSYAVKERGSTGDLCLDFGRENSLLTPHTLHLLVTNSTAIPAHLTTHAQHFPASLTSTPHPPPEHQTPLTTTSRRRKALLSRTVNIGDPASKTSQQASKEYMCGLLGEGRGCCFVVDPPSSSLLPFTTTTLTVTAYSDMWGDYQDTLLCQVSGLDVVEVPIRCSVSGCPLVFHSNASPQHSLIRFGSRPAASPPVQRVVRINNTSPEDIRVDWQTYNILQEDSCVVDLITTIGTPFPRLTPTHSPTPTHAHSPSNPSLSSPSTHSSDVEQRHAGGKVEPGRSSDDHRMEPGQGSSYEDDGGDEESDSHSSEGGTEPVPVVCVLLRPHEGVQAEQPFSIHPPQMVIPAHGQCSATVTFDPSLPGLGPSVSAYCLGYISLDHQPPSHVERPTGYELTALRVDLAASVDQPRLHLEADSDHGLHFSYPAHSLLHGEQVLSRVSKVHHVTLVNPTSSTLSFSLSSTSPHFTVTPSPPPSSTDDCSRLSPHTSISVSVKFHLSPDELRGCDEESISYSDTLRVHFSTGAVQEFPLTAEVCVPRVSVSVREVALGCCLLGHSLSSSSSLSLHNTTHSALPWTLHPSQDLQGTMVVSPSSGLLPPHLSTGQLSTQHILLTFTPEAECEYSGSVVVREVLTGGEVHVAVTASGTADEGHETAHT